MAVSPVIQSNTLLLARRQQATEQQEARGWDGGEVGGKLHMSGWLQWDGWLEISQRSLWLMWTGLRLTDAPLICSTDSSIFCISRSFSGHLSCCVLYVLLCSHVSIGVHTLLKPGWILPVLDILSTLILPDCQKDKRISLMDLHRGRSYTSIMKQYLIVFSFFFFSGDWLVKILSREVQIFMYALFVFFF